MDPLKTVAAVAKASSSWKLVFPELLAAFGTVFTLDVHDRACRKSRALDKRGRKRGWKTTLWARDFAHARSQQTHIPIFYIHSCSISTYIAHAPVRVSRLQQQPCDRVLRLALSYSVLRFSNDQARALDIPLLYTHIRPLPPTHVSTRLRIQSGQQALRARTRRVCERNLASAQCRIKSGPTKSDTSHDCHVEPSTFAESELSLFPCVANVVTDVGVYYMKSSRMGADCRLASRCSETAPWVLWSTDPPLCWSYGFDWSSGYSISRCHFK